MPISLATGTANEMLDIVTARAGEGSAGAFIRIYAGTAPLAADTVLTDQVLLAELVCTAPLAPGAANKTLVFNPINQDVEADNSGVATFFRVLSSEETVVLQGTVSEIYAGGDMQLNTTQITQGGPVQVTSFTLNLP